jgi:hypothetical protein
MPRIPTGSRIHLDEVLKHYTADENQAIHCMISCQTSCQMKFDLRHLTKHWSQYLENLLILVGSAYRKVMPHPKG